MVAARAYGAVKGHSPCHHGWQLGMAERKEPPRRNPTFCNAIRVRGMLTKHMYRDVQRIIHNQTGPRAP